MILEMEKEERKTERFYYRTHFKLQLSVSQLDCGIHTKQASGVKIQ